MGVKELDGKTMDGRRVRVEFTRDSRWADSGSRYGRGKPPGPRTGYRLVVENLSSSTSWQDLKDYMRQAGEVTYTNCHENRTGEGVAEFANGATWSTLLTSPMALNWAVGG